ncbi:MAG: hypothetical protein ACOZQL_00980 [Myxococcota bacterium]
MTSTRLLMLGVAGLLAGCGPAPSTGRLLPLSAGASWTYKITDSKGVFSDKKTTVEALEDVGGAKAGTRAFRVRTEDTGGATISWQEDTGTAVVRHREQEFDSANKQLTDTFFTPSKLRLDESAAHLTDRATFTTTHTERVTDLSTMITSSVDKTETWTVESLDEAVTVPAGTFHCVRLHRVGAAMGSSDKLYWFARGVGKVKETGGARSEELQAYSIP